MKQSAPPLFRVYQGLSTIVGPLAYRRIAAKLEAQGVPMRRRKERLGHATEARPNGRLLWFHAASVGESVSILKLIRHLADVLPDLHFLITSGTATSAQIVSERLPPRSRHQFAPLDTRRAVRRFLDHWKPSAALFVESELWPNMLAETQAKDVPIALINARISDRSAQNWKRFATTARYLLGHFSLIHCQTKATACHLRELGISDPRIGPNLKALSDPLPMDLAQLSVLKDQIGARPLWLASSTHPGEDEIVLAAHKALKNHTPDLLLILAPRHPERAGKIKEIITDQNLSFSQRSKHGQISAETDVYLADTLGETGLWYQLCPITCLCGSFVPVGGHNPFEPAQAASAILHGPLFANFADTYEALDAAGGGMSIAGSEALSHQIKTFLDDEIALSKMRGAAERFAQNQSGALDSFAQDLSKALALG